VFGAASRRILEKLEAGEFPNTPLALDGCKFWPGRPMFPAASLERFLNSKQNWANFDEIRRKLEIFILYEAKIELFYIKRPNSIYI
jgi:hypothetical protein